MKERREWSEEQEAMKDLEDSDFFGESENPEEDEAMREEMERVAKDYLKKTYGVDEMPDMPHAEEAHHESE